MCPALAGGFLTTAPPGKPWVAHCLNIQIHSASVFGDLRSLVPIESIETKMFTT